jgi:hypothetical protein
VAEPVAVGAQPRVGVRLQAVGPADELAELVEAFGPARSRAVELVVPSAGGG